MRRIIFLLGILLATIGVLAQQTVTVQAQSYQVSDNLDLEAVVITFGESKNVEDFERRLNDPENRISNLDLNNDGYVDFLRVVEVEEKGTHLIVIQAVIGHDLYQDVASVIVEGETKTSATVTIVGNRDIYGDNYVIVPRYVVRPVIFDWFWLPTYVVYRSLWYWDYYPHYYHHYTCLGYHSYHRHIHTWHSHHHHCDFHRPVEYHHHNHHVEMHRTVARNDYATHRPNQGYRTEPTPNHHIEARPTAQGRSAGSLSTSPNNTRIERPTTRIQSTTSTITRRPATTTTSPASTSRRTTPTTTITPTTSVTRKSTTLPVRSTTSTTSITTRKPATTTTSHTTTVTPRTTTSTTRSTSARLSSSSNCSTSTTNTSVRPSSSTLRPSSSATRTTSTAVKTNKNITTRR